MAKDNKPMREKQEEKKSVEKSPFDPGNFSDSTEREEAMKEAEKK
jgi:hypothetical protein